MIKCKWFSYLGVPAIQRAVLSAHTAQALSSGPVSATITNAVYPTTNL